MSSVKDKDERNEYLSRVVNNCQSCCRDAQTIAFKKRSSCILTFRSPHWLNHLDFHHKDNRGYDYRGQACLWYVEEKRRQEQQRQYDQQTLN